MDEIYRERAHLVAALSKLFPACIDPNPVEPHWPICFIDLPTGQVSWHIALSDMGLFAHLPKGERVWDRHTTEEKYARLDALTTASMSPLDQALAGAKRFSESADALALSKFAEGVPVFSAKAGEDGN